MTDEEKKAIFYLKDLENDKEHLIIEQRQSINIILNLIEKQQKEIEREKEKNKELIKITNTYDSFYANTGNRIVLADKEYFDSGMFIKNYISKDKIKAKIEEIENYYKELYKQDNSPNEFLISQDCLSKISILQEVKQSLLEEKE